MEGVPESDAEPPPEPVRKTLRTYSLVSRAHGCATELSILEGHHLGVRCLRPDGKSHEYQCDLRFVSPAPVRVHRIARAWLAVGIVLALVGAGALAVAWSASGPESLAALIGGLLGLSASVLALIACARRTTESLEFRSVHGSAALVSVTGGLGSTRGDNEFFTELSRDIEAAHLETTQPRQEFLCDQMREHHRLHVAGVLSASEYEASKARILAAHC